MTFIQYKTVTINRPVSTATFTGKERDEGTGFSYFGARYYDCDLSGLFLSVDPMSDKYSSISPYAYCAWNPLKFIDPSGSEFDDYYNLKGKLIRHTSEGNNIYLVITEDKDVIGNRIIAVPTNTTLKKMEIMYECNSQQKEKGIIVGTNGNSSIVVTGSATKISREQWQPAIDDMKELEEEADYLVHLHPADFYHLKIGSSDPSDTDRNDDNFKNSELGVILSFIQDYNPNRMGMSNNERDYTRTISFYNKTSANAIHKMSFRSFKGLVKDINKKSGRK